MRGCVYNDRPRVSVFFQYPQIKKAAHFLSALLLILTNHYGDSNFILNAAATCISSQVGGLATFAITGILGGIKVGDSVTGPGLGSGALTTYPAKVLSFAPTDPSNPVAGNITLDQNVTIQSGVTLTINDPDYLVYDYQSTKPFKTS